MISKSDIKYTLRMLAKAPGFTLLSILVLAGGLGVSILAFTFNYTMFYKPIPLENGDSIYHICAGPERSGCRPMKAFEFAEIRDEITTLDNIGIYHNSAIVIDIDGVPVSINATSTEWNMFQLSDTNPILGRGLLPVDQRAGSDPVIVVSHGFWQQHLNGDPDVVGRVFGVNGDPTRVVGVMPEGYQFPWRAPAWIPVLPEVRSPVSNGAVPVETYGLLQPGVTVSAASAEIETLMQRMREQYPSEAPPGTQLCRASVSLDCDTGHIATFPLGEFGGVGAILMIILTGLLTGFVFLLAAISVGTLLLARTNERMRDTSVRVALGAPRKRLLVQMMGESIVIALIGAVLGVLLAATVMDLLNIMFDSVDEQAMAFWQVFKVDASTIVGALAMVVLTVLLTSAMPSWRIINGDFNAVMQDGTRGARGLRPGLFNKGLVVVSIFVITLLLFLMAVAGTYAFVARDIILSLNADGVLVAQPRLDDRYDVRQVHRFYQNLHDDLSQDPGVESVYISSQVVDIGVEAERLLEGSGSGIEPVLVNISSVAGNLDTVNQYLLQGRLFADFENPETSPVILVNQSLAQQLWPGESALGQRVRIRSDSSAAQNPWREVIGIVADSETPSDILGINSGAAFLPLTQTDVRFANVQVKAREGVGREVLSAAIRQAVLGLMPELGSVRVLDLQQQRDSLNAALVLGLNMSGGTALFAFLVAIAGIFGLTQNFVLASTQEIGTRRALGAGDSLIRRTFLRRGGKQALIGFFIASIVIVPIVWLSFATLGMEVVAVTIAPVTGAMIFLYGTILFAIYQPLRNILMLEPSEALRHE